MLGCAAVKSVSETLDSCGEHVTCAKAVVSVPKMLSVICLTQLKLHSVNGRSASGDFLNKAIVVDIKNFQSKTSSANSAGTGPPSITRL